LNLLVPAQRGGIISRSSAANRAGVGHRGDSSAGPGGADAGGKLGSKCLPQAARLGPLRFRDACLRRPCRVSSCSYLGRSSSWSGSGSMATLSAAFAKAPLRGHSSPAPPAADPLAFLGQAACAPVAGPIVVVTMVNVGLAHAPRRGARGAPRWSGHVPECYRLRRPVAEALPSLLGARVARQLSRAGPWAGGGWAAPRSVSPALE